MKRAMTIFLVLISLYTLGQQTVEQVKEDVFGKLNTERLFNGILINSSVSPLKMADFPINLPSEINAESWYRIYSKVYSAYLKKPDIPSNRDIVEIVKEIDKDNIIPFGLFYFKYSSIKEDAIVKGLLKFTHNTLYESSSKESPYNVEECLALAPLLQNVNSPNVQFVLKNDLIFNNTNSEITQISIDFEDGLGMRNVLPNTLINVVYNSYGEKKIIGNVLINGRKHLVYTSILVGDEHFQLKSGDENDFGDVVNPDEKYAIETTYNSAKIKGDWGVYYGCDDILDKPILVIEGFDPLDSKGLDPSKAKNNLYAITDTKQHLLNNLRNAGYDIVILDFERNNIDLRASGKLAAELIEEVNRQKQGGNELVVMGRSGGGLLARYALAYLEENNIDHQTRLLLTIDAPNRGANIPLGFQHFLETIDESPLILGLLGAFATPVKEELFGKTLNCTYAKQILNYHYQSTDIGNNKAYPSSDRSTFFADLDLLNNGYPDNVLKVAISDGSRFGVSQGFGFNDNLINWIFAPDACATIRFNIEVNALPELNDLKAVLSASLDIRMPIIPCVLYTSWVSVLKKDIRVDNTLPYDNAPGGNAGWHRFNVAPFMPDWTIDGISYMTGITVEDDFECFVPVVSALDLNSNILPSEHGGLFYNVDANLSNNSNISRVGNFFYNLSPPTVSPFDVLYTSPSNQEHAESNSEWTSLFEGEIYPTNLYLQNQEITHDRVYYARNSITAGNNVTTDLPQGEFVIKSGAKVKMTSGGSITLSPGFSAELGSEFIATIHEETDCNIANMSSLKSAKIISDNQQVSEIKTSSQNPLVDIITSTEKSISVYPNPANTTLIVSFNKYSDEKLNVKIFDNSGKQISSIKNANRITEINVSDFQPGFYTVLISHGKEVYSEKFIKQ